MKVEIRLHPVRERGLFAKDLIRKGDYICILPIDYLQINSKWYTLDSVNNGPINFRYGILCDLVVPKNDKSVSVLGTFTNFLVRESKTRNRTRIELSGASNPERTDGDFIGHMINDSVDMSIMNKNRYENISNRGENITIETDIEIFKNEETGVKRLGLRVIAKRLIKKNEELFFTYGVDYWKNYSGNDIFEISPKIETIACST